VVLSASEVRRVLAAVAAPDQHVCLLLNLGHKNPAATVIYTHLTSLCQTQHQQRLDKFMSNL